MLEIAYADGARRQALAPSTVAWCAAASQCEQQYLPTPLCTGQWTCVDGGCQFQCGWAGPLQLE
ncbi:MAG TPA: hypothetical protein VFB81_11690 [Myxococcales bacterium]|nr:hypothetical protein [Myxococcales bacterium]